MAASIYVSPFWPALLLRAPLGSPAQGFSLVPEHRRPTVPAALLVRKTRVRLGNQTAAVSVPRCRLGPRPAELARPPTALAVGPALRASGILPAVLQPAPPVLRPVALWHVVLPLTQLPGSPRPPLSPAVARRTVSVFRHAGSSTNTFRKCFWSGYT